VKPSLVKYAARATTGAYKDSHYRTVYFHESGPHVDAAFERYLTAIARAVNAFRERRRIFVAMAATEALDTRACQRISEKLGGVPVFSSEQYDMYQMVSILRAGHMMASSRFHGIVTTMPSLLPSCGITMDERIRNLMHDRGHQDLLMNVDDDDLEPKLLAALEKLATDGERIADGIGRTVVKNLKLMARMGVYFEEELRRRYSDFPTRNGQLSWEDYLPPIDEGLRRLIAMYS
jgi:polysaccharide pyruvyl transferase WcaK-like protein